VSVGVDVLHARRELRDGSAGELKRLQLSLRLNF